MAKAVLAQKVKTRPIIFGAESVRAILEGRKTQTRRVFKDSPFNYGRFPHRYPNGEWGIYFDRPTGGAHLHIGFCPYGKAGERLWVREACMLSLNKDAAMYADAGGQLAPRAEPGSENHCRMWKPCSPIHMPRWASRITLELTEVRAERLQDITDDDAKAEGVDPRNLDADVTLVRHTLQKGSLAVDRYARAWDELNAARGFGWDVNPWVWVLTFKKVDD